MKLKSLLIGVASSTLIVSAASAGSITAVSWGGAYTKSQVEAYHKPWASKTGHQVVSEDYGGGLAEIRSQVEAGNVTWDIVDVELSDAVLGCDEGLLENRPINASCWSRWNTCNAGLYSWINNRLCSWKYCMVYNLCL